MRRVDDGQSVFRALDFLFGPRLIFPYRVFYQLWTVHRFGFISVSPLKDQAKVLNTLGVQM